MAQVPYSGAPAVAPQFEPTPRYQVDVKPEAFGVNVWQSVRQLGDTADKVGGEIFARGVAMQDLANHSEAQQADAAYMQKAGELHAEFSSKQGKDAVTAYPDYIKNLAETRKTIGGTLSNPMAQKLYDTQSLSTYGRTVFNGAGHAGQQNKVYAVQSSQSKVEAINAQVLGSPFDEDGFKTDLATAENEVRSQVMLKGGDEDMAKEAVAQNRSMLYSQKIRGMIKERPLEADKFAKEAIKSGDIRGEDIAKITNLTETTRRTVGARVVSSQVSTGAGLRWGQGQVDIKQAQEAIGSIESGGNYGAIGVQTSHGRALGKYQVMEEFLPEFLRKAGLPAMSGDEYLKNKAAQDQVFAANFGGYMKQTGNANDAASMWLSGKPLSKDNTAKDALGTNAQEYVRRFNAALAKGAPLSDRVAMGNKLATDHAPDDPLFPEYVRTQVEGDFRRDLAVKRDDEWNTKIPIENALVGGMEGGKIPTSLEDLRSDPKVSAAWDKLGELDPAKQRYYMGILARNAKGDHAFTAESLKTYLKFNGMAHDPERIADFVDPSTSQAILDSGIPMTKQAELLKLQQSMRGKSDAGNPQVSAALKILGPDLQAAGIDGKDKDQKAQFVGSLADQLRQFSLDNSRPPKYEEVRQIGARLLQAQETPGRFFGTNTYPTYQVPVPRDVLTEAKRLNPTLSDWDIQREYTRQLYKEKFGKAPKAAATPNVPVSQ